MAEEKPQKITRQFIVKEPGLKGKHDTPTVIFRNATGTEQLKIVLGSKSLLKDYPVNAVFVMDLTIHPQLSGDDLEEKEEEE
jgi:hypothetical protein